MVGQIGHDGLSRLIICVTHDCSAVTKLVEQLAYYLHHIGLEQPAAVAWSPQRLSKVG